MDMKLEVVTLPVSDVDRAKASIRASDGGSTSTWPSATPSGPCSSRRLTRSAPSSSARAARLLSQGRLQKTFLVVDDIDVARHDLISRGVDVSEVQETRPPGFDSQGGRSYFARASFSDPDGNSWVLQEITTRLPGREWDDSRTSRLWPTCCTRRPGITAQFEAVAPPHNWWDWYAAYANARQGGSTQEEAAAAAGRYMAEVKHIVVPPA